jgi:hypothetical protein
LASTAVAVLRGQTKPGEIVSVDKIWDRSPHQAFTDLLYHRGRFYCVFREGSAHVSENGSIRVLSSSDATNWETAAELTDPVADLRDPHLCVMPDGQLMLTAAAAMRPGFDYTHHTMVWYSREGRDWTPAERIGEPNVWIWRMLWKAGRCYGFGYSTSKERFLRVYISHDGNQFQVLNPKACSEDFPSEAAVITLPNDSALCVLRREGGPSTGLLGKSLPPYRGWSWSDLGTRVGGPQMLRLPDARILVAARLYDGRTRTSLCWLDTDGPALSEFMRLPSGGDTSYAGLVLRDDLLHVSYYSSHEGKSSIYLAKVRLPSIS